MTGRISAVTKCAAAAWLVLWLALHLRAYPLASMLWFCAYGNVLLVAGLVLEQRLLLSWQAVALLVPQLAYAGNALLGGDATAYLFDARTPFAVRSLSLFHFVTPVIAWWGVRRVGYDARALPLQIATSTAVLVASFFMDGNVNLARGPASGAPLVTPELHLLVMLAAMPLVCYLPADRLLRITAPESAR